MRATAPWLTTADLCARLKVSRMTLYRWERDGYFPPPLRPTGAGPGRIVRWRASDIEEYERRLVEDAQR